MPRQMVLDGITFKLDSADIEPASERTLQRALQALRDDDAARVEIAGHTDSQGTAEYNRTLSEDRANAVASCLRARGIDARRHHPRLRRQPAGLAEHRRSRRARYRRIEFVRVD